MEAHVVPPGEGEPISQGERRTVAILAGRPELAVTESRYEPGERGPDPHFHRRHSDAFYVLEGALVFEIADELIEAPAGTFVLVPPNVVHSFWNDGPARARFLNFHAPDEGFAESLRLRAAGDAEGAAAIFDSVDV
jgi:quercetin dioxygenase-like cupin family protein